MTKSARRLLKLNYYSDVQIRQSVHPHAWVVNVCHVLQLVSDSDRLVIRCHRRNGCSCRCSYCRMHNKSRFALKPRQKYEGNVIPILSSPLHLLFSILFPVSTFLLSFDSFLSLPLFPFWSRWYDHVTQSNCVLWSVSWYLISGTCYHLISRTLTLIVNSSSWA